MDRTEKIDFNRMTTFEIAFNLATGKYNEIEKFEALKVIQERDSKVKDAYLGSSSKDHLISKDKQPSTVEKPTIKPPLKGSKSEKIFKLMMEDKSVQETFENLNKKGITVYYPEIYRVYKKYGKA